MHDISDQTLSELRRVLDKARTDYPLIEVLERVKVSIRSSLNEYVANCPFPAHFLRSPTFKIDINGTDHFSCYACGACGDVFDFVGALYGVSTIAKQFETLTGKSLQSQFSVESTPEIQLIGKLRKEVIECQVAPDHNATAVYDALLDQFPLLDHHRDYLIWRGVPSDSFKRLRYCSLPSSRNERIRICERLIESGHCLDGVPGFFQLPLNTADENLRGRWCIGGNSLGYRMVTVKTEAGTSKYQFGAALIPVRDSQDNVVRLEVHNDDPPCDIPRKVRQAWPSSARTLTSNGRLNGAGGGASGGSRLHHAYNWKASTDTDSATWVIEGALAADVVSLRLGVNVIGIPGSGQLVEETIEAASVRPQLFIALDSNEYLQIARLCREAKSKDITPFIVRWDRKEVGKFERCAFFGSDWSLIHPDEWWSACPPEIRNEIKRGLAFSKL